MRGLWQRASGIARTWFLGPRLFAVAGETNRRPCPSTSAQGNPEEWKGWNTGLRYSRRAGAALALIVLSVALWASCGGGSSGGAQSNPGTPAGTYSLTISATGGSLTHTATLSLKVH